MKTEGSPLRLTRATVKETADGGKTGDATIRGQGLEEALKLAPSIGQAIEIAAGEHRLAGHLRQITLKAGKDAGQPCAIALKISGPAELDELVGRPVRLRDLQLALSPVKA